MPRIAELLFWAVAALLICVYVGYPALLALLSAFFRGPKPQPGDPPTLSISISAYNEEASIREKIEQIVALDYPSDKMEILVLFAGSTDRTDSIVKGRTAWAGS